MWSGYTRKVTTRVPLDFEYRGRRRVICCHRAEYSGAFPPNSLAAVRECVREGAPRLEIDVRFLRDDSMLIFHDGDLSGETNGVGRVDALDADAAKKLHFTTHPEHGLCFLEDVVEAMAGSTTMLQVDLKLMRPISRARLGRLAEALRPVEGHVLIGSQAHWNLRGLRDAGFRVALDPTLHWHYAPNRPMEMTPRRLGVHGLWDDAPLAHIRHASAQEYADSRIADLVGVLPGAVEWMVDIATVRHLGTLGVNLGACLDEHGIELAAWTFRNHGPATAGAIREMLDLGATTLIADDPTVAAGHRPSVNGV